MDLISLARINHREYGQISCIQASSTHLFIGTTFGHILLYKIEKIIAFRSNPQKDLRNSTLKRASDALSENISATFCKSFYMGKKKPIQKLELDEDMGFRVLFVLWDNQLFILRLDLSKLVMKVAEVQGLTDISRDMRPGSHRIACIVKKKLIILHYVSDNCMKLKEFFLPEFPVCMIWYGKVLALGYKKHYSLNNVDINDDSDASRVIYSLDIPKGTQPELTLLQSELVILTGKVGIGIHADDTRMGEPVSRSSIPWSSNPLVLSSCFPYIIALLENKHIEIFSIYDREDVLSLKVDDIRYMSRGEKLGLYLASQDSIFILSPISIQNQIEELIRKVKCTEAFELFERTYEGSIEEKKILKSQLYLDAGFVCLFSQKIEEAFRYFRETNFDVRELLVYFPDLIPKDFIPQRPLDKPILDLEEKFLNQLQIEAKNLKEQTKKDNKVHIDKLKNEFEQEQYRMEAHQLYRKSRDYLLHLLLDIRLKKLRGKESSSIDTSLVKLMIYFDRTTDLEQLLRKKNNCDINQLEVLKEYNQYLYAVLLRNKSDTKGALDILRRLGDDDSVIETVSILQECTDERIIFPYAIWIMEKDCKLGLHIFTVRRSEPLKAERVIRFLKEIQKEDTLTSNYSLRRFLEFIITEENNSHPQYHTQLALLYIDILTTKGNSEESLDDIRQKLHIHLASSSFYDTEFILKRLEDTSLYTERVFVYEKLNDHENVVDLYLNHLNDSEMALNYALGTLLQSSTHRFGSMQKYEMKKFQSPRLLALLKVCFRKAKFLHYGIEILNRYGQYLDASKALEILPEHLDLKCLSKFVTKSILELEQDRRDVTIMKTMHSFNYFDTLVKYHNATGKMIRVKKNATCFVCGEYLSKGIVLYPDGSMAHFSCRHPKLNINPNGRNFIIEPGDFWTDFKKE